MSELDHLVVAAADLAEGARWVEERLGVAMDAGGRHEVRVVRVASLAGERHVIELSRGSNRWALTVAPDGRMPLGGIAPSRILWHSAPPATLLPDKGVRLDTLSISAPDVAALRLLVADVAGPVEVEPGDSALAATFSTPSGRTAIGPTG